MFVVKVQKLFLLRIKYESWHIRVISLSRKRFPFKSVGVYAMLKYYRNTDTKPSGEKAISQRQVTTRDRKIIVLAIIYSPISS